MTTGITGELLASYDLYLQPDAVRSISMVSIRGSKMDNDWSGRSDVYYRKVIRKDNDAVSLDADMIRLLIAIDVNKNLYQIAEEVDMGTAEFKKALSKLIDQSLIEPVQKDVAVLGHSFIQTLRIYLSRAIGPMAEILIEDQADEMDIDPAAIPINQAAELIAHLSLEVPDEENQMQFKKSMLAILNKFKG